MSLQAGYYMPKVDVIRRDYEIMYPALEDLQFAGINIMLECGGYNTYRLEKRDPFDRLIGNYIIALLNETFGKELSSVFVYLSECNRAPEGYLG